MLCILDTDVHALLERGGVDALPIQIRLEALPADLVVTTTVTCEERLRGWLALLTRTSDVLQHVAAYRALRRTLENLSRLPLVDFDDAAAAIFLRLRRDGVRIGTMDLKIASIALAYDAILLTRNRRDFEKVPGLRLDDWAAEASLA